MAKPKIFMCSSVHRWDDTRILYKEAQSLAKHYAIELHIPAPFSQKKWHGVTIHGLPLWAKKSDRFFIHLILARRILFSKIRLIHFHDPELIPLSILLKVLFNKTIVYDIHEDYPEQIMHAEWLPVIIRRMLSRMIFSLEKSCQNIFDHCITVTPSISKNFHPNAITIIYNYPILKNRICEKNNRFTFTYVGDLRPDRGLLNICEAFQMLLSIMDHNHVELHIAGKLSGDTSFNEKMTRFFKQNNIYYHGLLPFEKGQRLMARSHVGIIPSLPKSNYLQALPNKLFEYMSNQQFLIVSSFPHWEKIVKKWNVGMTFEPGNSNDLMLAMKYCFDHKVAIMKQAERGKEIVFKYYNWQTQEKKLYYLYSTLAGEQKEQY